MTANTRNRRLIHQIKKGALLLAVCLLLLCTGCQALDVFSVDSLVRAPKLTGKYALIQQSFEAAVGTDVRLVNPLSGEYSAFVFVDYDNDGEDETLVFYTKNDAPEEIHMHFMDLVDGQWQSVGDAPGFGNEVYKVEFANVDADDYKEILLTLTSSDSKRGKKLGVYKYTPDKKEEEPVEGTDSATGAVSGPFRQLLSQQIVEYLTMDLDFNGTQDILYLASDTAAQTPVIKAVVIMTTGEDGAFQPISEKELSRSVEMPDGDPLFDRARGFHRIYFDCINYDDTYITEILIYDDVNNTLLLPQDDAGENLSAQTRRPEKISSRKERNDSVVTVPIRYAYEGSRIIDKENDVENMLYVTEFVQLTDNGFETVGGKYFYDSTDGCRINLDKVFERCILEYDLQERELRFFDEIRPDDLLFSIRFGTPLADASLGDEAQMPRYDIYISNFARGRGFNEETVKNMIEAVSFR